MPGECISLPLDDQALCPVEYQQLGQEPIAQEVLYESHGLSNPPRRV